jgi:hypothetical protein
MSARSSASRQHGRVLVAPVLRRDGAAAIPTKAGRAETPVGYGTRQGMRCCKHSGGRAFCPVAVSQGPRPRPPAMVLGARCAARAGLCQPRVARTGFRQGGRSARG